MRKLLKVRRAKNFKPCPFCGERDNISLDVSEEGRYVQCFICGAKSTVYPVTAKGSVEKAEKAWNRRANDG